MTGTFEAILATRARPVLTIIGPGVYSLLLVCVQALLMVAIGRLAMGAKLQLAHLGLVTVVIAMTIASLTGIGLMSAAFVVAFKQTEPVTTGLAAASLMVSGILYPTTVPPAWLARLVPLLPMTHAVEITRGLLLERAAVGSLAVHFVVLGLYSLSLPASLLLLSAAITQAKRAGSLAHSPWRTIDCDGLCAAPSLHRH